MIIGQTYKGAGRILWTCIENKQGKQFDDFGFRTGGHDYLDSPDHPFVCVSWTDVDMKEHVIDVFRIVKSYYYNPTGNRVDPDPILVKALPEKIQKFLDEHRSNKTDKKFIVNNAILLCTDSYDNVCQFLHEPIPASIDTLFGKKYTGRVVNITYETYCEIYGIKPVYEKPKTIEEEFSDFIESVHGYEFLGCQRENVVEFLKSYGALIKSVKKFPSEYARLAEKSIKSALDTELSFHGCVDAKTTTFCHNAIQAMRKLRQK